MIYALVIAIVSILACVSILVPRSGYTLGLIAAVALMLLAGLRGDSVDYDEYLILFALMDAAQEIELPARLFVGKDLLFGALMAAVQAAGWNASMLFLVSAVLSVGLKFIAFGRAFGQTAVPLLASLFLYYFLHDFTQVRVAIALGWCYWGLVELCNRRWLRWLLLSSIGVGFHASAILLLPFAPLALLRRRNIPVASAALALAMLLMLPVALELLGSFDRRAEVYAGPAQLSWVPLAIAVVKVLTLTWLHRQLDHRLDPHSTRLLDASLLLCWAGPVFLFRFVTDAPAIAFRTYELFDAFSVFIVAQALLRGSLATRLAALMLCALAMAAMLNSGLLVPYTWATF